MTGLFNSLGRTDPVPLELKDDFMGIGRFQHEVCIITRAWVEGCSNQSVYVCVCVCTLCMCVCTLSLDLRDCKISLSRQ